ncbi:MAG: class D sortase [bacterium]|nr:class D sortase [bacterium]
MLDAMAAPVAEMEASLREIVGQTGFVGRIEIPRIGLDEVVLADADDRSLDLWVGHLSRTALPDEPGNLLLAGHRDSHFRKLRDIRLGDAIHVTTPLGTFEYQVEETMKVWPGRSRCSRTWASPAVAGHLLSFRIRRPGAETVHRPGASGVLLDHRRRRTTRLAAERLRVSDSNLRAPWPPILRCTWSMTWLCSSCGLKLIAVSQYPSRHGTFPVPSGARIADSTGGRESPAAAPPADPEERRCHEVRVSDPRRMFPRWSVPGRLPDLLFGIHRRLEQQQSRGDLQQHQSAD